MHFREAHVFIEYIPDCFYTPVELPEVIATKVAVILSL